MKAFHQLTTIENILNSYKEDMPLHRFLAQFYRKNKQMGSKDRKTSSRLLYNYFRLGNALSNVPLVDKLTVAEFLCNNSSNSFITYYKPEWEALLTLSITEKIKLVEKECPLFDLKDVFPFYQHLSTEISEIDFLHSFFVQPSLYVRLKSGFEKKFIKKLNEEHIVFQQIGDKTLSFANGTKLDHLLDAKGWYEVQDLSSQEVGEYFMPNKWDKWWDACAASGGKSLMLLDHQPDIKLLVSDIRPSILDNLDQRFRDSGVKSYHKLVMDLTLSQNLLLHDHAFDGIVLDAPCSGSGTWGRTPEMIAQFNEVTINFFQNLQRKIVTNVVPYIKKGKPLIYITCSAFTEENEEQVNWIVNEFGFEVEKTALIKGYEHKADTMFVARLIKL